ncbi:helix-turn-helix domain-containing protein [Dactylosporangium roseum]|uniref:Helix-turn-helix domain-containing protein n=1 Tax=Dactylosporangium roseum TaxID=47989 RepID=A0ABY5YY46_9ACTN|nr:helix-turn-helix domain-containing protein [Dactylosporangium roseum]
MRPTTRHREDFWAEMTWMLFGGLHLSQVRSASFEVERTGQLIRQSDPDGYQLSVSLRGDSHFEQRDRYVAAGPTDIFLYDTSRAFRAATVVAPADARPGPDGRPMYPADGLIVHIPRNRLPLPAARVERLLAVSMTGDAGVGAVLLGTLKQLIAQSGSISDIGASTLAGVVLDLLGALLTERLDMPPRLDNERHTALFLCMRMFIEENLSDPNLSLSDIARAHHVSLRSLHKVFERSGTTAAAWIRRRRLDRCRLDLANPALDRVPVHNIARRWGFVNDSHFNRAFRAEFGVSPAAYRRHGSAMSAGVG